MKNAQIVYNYNSSGMCVSIDIYRGSKKRSYGRLHCQHYHRITLLTVKCPSYSLKSADCLDYNPATIVMIGVK